jgi:bifunctional non-homologous end joining protein LigD
LHVVAPLTPHATWEEHKTFAATLTQTLVARSPDLYLATVSKAQRKNKVFIDYLRNQRGATAIASYSSRARAGAPVATPLAWDELSPKLQPAQFTVQTVPKRMASLGSDPWEGFPAVRQKLTSRLLDAAQSVLDQVRGK